MAEVKRQNPGSVSQGLNIESKTVTTIRDTGGLEIVAGDTIILKVGNETVICTFKALPGTGYFETIPIGETETVKYRIDSIAECWKVGKLILEKEFGSQE